MANPNKPAFYLKQIAQLKGELEAKQHGPITRQYQINHLVDKVNELAKELLVMRIRNDPDLGY